MVDWVDSYIDNEGFESQNRAFSFVNGKRTKAEDRKKLRDILKEVVRECSNKENELNLQNFKKLKIIVINEFCFDNFSRLRSKNASEYEYVIFIPCDFVPQDDAVIKRKLAHELAHFLFVLKQKQFNGSGEEEKACNMKADEWGFPNGK